VNGFAHYCGLQKSWTAGLAVACHEAQSSSRARIEKARQELREGKGIAIMPQHFSDLNRRISEGVDKGSFIDARGASSSPISWPLTLLASFPGIATDVVTDSQGLTSTSTAQ
jgi:hypothetical protein